MKNGAPQDKLRNENLARVARRSLAGMHPDVAIVAIIVGQIPRGWQCLIKNPLW